MWIAFWIFPPWLRSVCLFILAAHAIPPSSALLPYIPESNLGKHMCLAPSSRWSLTMWNHQAQVPYWPRTGFLLANTLGSVPHDGMNLPPPKVDALCGCNGVDETWPRLMCGWWYQLGMYLHHKVHRTTTHHMHQHYLGSSGRFLRPPS